MKTTILKKAIHIVMFCLLILTTVIITKVTITNIKYLYGSEKDTSNILTCFCDLIQ